MPRVCRADTTRTAMFSTTSASVSPSAQTAPESLPLWPAMIPIRTGPGLWATRPTTGLAGTGLTNLAESVSAELPAATTSATPLTGLK